MTSAELVIIGAGISGAAAACFAAEQGVAALLLDKGTVAGEQSGRAWGFVRQQGRDASELALMMACNRLWRGLETRLDADIGWQMCGNLGIAADEAGLDHYRRWLPVAAAHGLDTRLVDAGELAELLPGLAGTWAGGLTTASDGHADPQATTLALAAAASRHGVRVIEHCGVRRLVVRGARVCGVDTESGFIATERVICAAGAWSGQLLRPLLDLPQLRVRGSVALTEPASEGLVPIAAWTPEVAFRQRRDGAIVVARFDEFDHDISLESLRRAWQFRHGFSDHRRSFHLRFGEALYRDIRHRLGSWRRHGEAVPRDAVPDPQPTATSVQRAMAALHRTLPATRDLRLARSWACYFDATPDMLPLIGAVPEPRGLVLATGLSGHGFGLGPMVGELAARLALELPVDFDLRPFSPLRFAAAAG